MGFGFSYGFCVVGEKGVNNMLILPAIDIKGGECVRLVKGDFGTAQKVAANAVETARFFESCGAKFIHIVDLDGALEGRQVNRNLILKIAKAVNVSVEVGGGIRDMDIADDYLNNGISRVILGSAALKNQKFLMDAVDKYDERIAVGIDARNGTVKFSGWLENSQFDYIFLAKMVENIGVKYIIFTDIDRDGTLEGPNLEQLVNLKNEVKCNIIASGGIRDIEDIKALKAVGMYGAICGKSVYSGTLDLKEAVAVS